MVKGLRALERKFNVSIPRAVERHLKQQMAVAADKIVATAEAFVPEDSGDLKNSIGWVWGSNAPKGSISIGTVAASDEDLVITIFAGNDEAYYARWVEFGTKTAAANPYFFPAYRLNKRATRARITKAIKAGLKEGSR